MKIKQFVWNPATILGIGWGSVSAFLGILVATEFRYLSMQEWLMSDVYRIYAILFFPGFLYHSLILYHFDFGGVTNPAFVISLIFPILVGVMILNLIRLFVSRIRRRGGLNE